MLQQLITGLPTQMLDKWLRAALSSCKKTFYLGRVELCCTFYAQQYIGSHININASDNLLA
ncbi:hypothetical protein [Vibrio sp. ES.051]|uniref:hypothetical protein n=1 Tax=Vibrio sp. ES.051 TaxID=1761909 RepID=UPI0015CF50E4|nr:hypothetical protein [Vibrio sp. ES.051]